MHDEIFEQPGVLERLSQRRREFEALASSIRSRDIAYVFLVARGTSDNAGLYAKYLLGAHSRLPVALAAPSLFTRYKAPPRLERALVLGISQSGASTDILEVVQGAREQGAMTLVMTNDIRSPVAQAADHVVDLLAGVERAVAATKTYTAELMCVAMLSTALTSDEAGMKALAVVPQYVSEALGQDQRILSMAEECTEMDRCFVLGRGFNYATAYEWSLKLKECAYVLAEPYSPADLHHGPIAIIERGFPVLAVLARGAVYEEMLALVQRLIAEKGAELAVVSNDRQALECAHWPISFSGDVPEWISPMVSIVPGQLFAYHLARAKGLDPDHPRGLTKVTMTE